MMSGLREEHTKHIADVLTAVSSVRAAVLFGSRAMGTFRKASDVDLALLGDDISLQEQIRITGRLNENKSLLVYDVLRFSTLSNAALTDHIRQYGITVFERHPGAAGKFGFGPVAAHVPDAG